MSNHSTTLSSNSTLTIIDTSTASPPLKNDDTFNIITNLLNGSDLYEHQMADLMEPEKFAVRSVHITMWAFTIITYILAIPMFLRMIRSKAYLNVMDYFSFHYRKKNITC